MLKTYRWLLKSKINIQLLVIASQSLKKILNFVGRFLFPNLRY